MRNKEKIEAEIEDVEHEISMEEARHSDETLRLTRRLRALEEELEAKPWKVLPIDQDTIDHNEALKADQFDDLEA